MSIGTATQPSKLIKAAASPALLTILHCTARANQTLQMPACTGNYGIEVGGGQSDQQQPGSFLLVREQPMGSLCPLWLLMVAVMLVSHTVDLLHMESVVTTSCDPSDLCPLVVCVQLKQSFSFSSSSFSGIHPPTSPLSASPPLLPSSYLSFASSFSFTNLFTPSRDRRWRRSIKKRRRLRRNEKRRRNLVRWKGSRQRRRKKMSRSTGGKQRKMMMKMWRRSQLLLEVNLMFELQQTEELLAAQSPSDTSAVSIATL